MSIDIGSNTDSVISTQFGIDLVSAIIACFAKANAAYAAVTSPPLGEFAALTANGTSQADATPLTANNNLITQANANSGVIITSPIGTIQYILNRDPANTLNIYPPVGTQIEQQPVNTPLQIPQNINAGMLLANATQVLLLVGGPIRLA